MHSVLQPHQGMANLSSEASWLVQAQMQYTCRLAVLW